MGEVGVRCRADRAEPLGLEGTVLIDAMTADWVCTFVLTDARFQLRVQFSLGFKLWVVAVRSIAYLLSFPICLRFRGFALVASSRRGIIQWPK